MTLKIRRACVLGAGVMGAQIAAHLAAAGVRTHLLDLASAEPPADKNQAKLLGKNFRSARAVMAVENLKTLKPAPFYSMAFVPSIIPGNFDDDMSVLAECDWIIEAVIERLDIKQNLHKRIAEYARPHVPVTTNTSGISLESIVQDLPEEYQARFFGTHFFNPPRYMKLLEVIPHAQCDRKLLDALTGWIHERLGKGIVEARDTVNFIANRIGVFATQSALKHMGDLGLNVETVDALTGPLIGRAKSATLRTMDVVGLDTFVAVARNTWERAKDDPFREWFKGPRWIEELIEKGALGQKSNAVGCYKKDKDAKGRTLILAYRPETRTYVEQAPATYGWSADAEKERDTVKRIKTIIAQDDAGAKFVWMAIRDVFSYASFLLKDIAGGLPKPVDEALRWGFNWEMGPFELWQALGYDDILARMKKDGVPVADWLTAGLKFYDQVPGTPQWIQAGGPAQQHNAVSGKAVAIKRPAWAFNLPKFENTADPRRVLSCKSASLLDLGDGVACLTFHSKMNSIDLDIIDTTMKAVGKVQSGFDALLVANEGQAFSAGANLKMILEAIQGKRWDEVERIIRLFQGAVSMLKFAPFPTVSCPFGLVLGGGCEVALQTSHRYASAETYAGLVELGVGLIPAGGGTKELALRAYEQMNYAERGDPMQFLQRAFMLIGMARVSASAHEAVEMGLLPRDSTTIGMSQDHLVAHAKRRARLMADEGYVPKTPAANIKVVGDPGVQTFRMMLYNMAEARQVSAYDAHLGVQVATVLCGGEVDAGSLVDEQYFLDLERRVFVELCQQPKTAERIEAMLKTGKALRN